MTSKRQILTEFLELYRDHPCLWDVDSSDYRNKIQRQQAWELLADKLKPIEPTADIFLARKKVELMRTAYKREFKKVKESKRTSSGASKVHIPFLWYYNLLTFLDIKDEQSRIGVDVEGSQHHNQQSTFRSGRSRTKDSKKLLLIATAHQLLQDKSKPNSFGLYLNDQLEEITDKFQRQVAEKVISEIIFLAKIGNLNYDSKIETLSRSHLSFPNNPHPSPHSFQPSPSQCNQITSPVQTISPQNIQSTESVFQYSSSHIMQPSSLQTIQLSPSTSPPASCLLKELLIDRKHY